MMRLQTICFAFWGVMAITTSPLSKVPFLKANFSTNITSPDMLNVGIIDGPAHWKEEVGPRASDTLRITEESPGLLEVWFG